MANNATKIEWADKTWNPTRGCTMVSEGCRNCYAMRIAGSKTLQRHYAGLVRETKLGPVWTGEVRTVPEHLRNPISWRAPSNIFVDSMSDLFHEKIPDAFIAAVLGVAVAAPQHNYLILTKRAERMRQVMTEIAGATACLSALEAISGEFAQAPMFPPAWPLANVWLGVSVEDQRSADARVPELRACPAAHRFISAEPLLGRVAFADLAGVEWVIGGGESGAGARPCHPGWARALRDGVVAAGVHLTWKQWGTWSPVAVDRETARAAVFENGTHLQMWPDRDRTIYRVAKHDQDRYAEKVRGGRPVEMFSVGKEAAGRMLDGEIYDWTPGLPA